MKHERKEHKKSWFKRTVKYILLTALLLFSTIFIINMPQKILDDYINSLPENKTYSVSIKNELPADSISEINQYFGSFYRTESNQNVINVDEEIQGKILEKIKNSFSYLFFDTNGINSEYTDFLRILSDKLQAFTEDDINNKNLELYVYILTTDCYGGDDSYSSITLYNIDMVSLYPEEERYSFYLSENMDSIFSLRYYNMDMYADSGNVSVFYDEKTGIYSFDNDFSYLALNAEFEFFLSYVNENDFPISSQFVIPAESAVY